MGSTDRREKKGSGGITKGAEEKRRNQVRRECASGRKEGERDHIREAEEERRTARDELKEEEERDQ